MQRKKGLPYKCWATQSFQLASFVKPFGNRSFCITHICLEKKSKIKIQNSQNQNHKNSQKKKKNHKIKINRNIDYFWRKNSNQFSLFSLV